MVPLPPAPLGHYAAASQAQLKTHLSLSNLTSRSSPARPLFRSLMRTLTPDKHRKLLALEERKIRQG